MGDTGYRKIPTKLGFAYIMDGCDFTDAEARQLSDFFVDWLETHDAHPSINDWPENLQQKWKKT